MLFLINLFKNLNAFVRKNYIWMISLLLIFLMISCNSTSSDGNTSDTDPILSSLTLKNLEVSTGQLTPLFNPTTSNYKMEVDSHVMNVTVTATSENPNISITINNEPAVSGFPSNPITLRTGDNIIRVILTKLDDGITRSYNILIKKKEKIPENMSLKLSNLEISEGKLDPVFSPDVNNYEVVVKFSVNEISVTATADNSNINLSINDEPLLSGIQSNPIAVDSKVKEITITLTDQIDQSYRNYNIIIIKESFVNVIENSIVTHIDPEKGTNFTLNLDLGSQPTDLYFIFTNTSTSIKNNAPSYSAINGPDNIMRSSIYEEKHLDSEKQIFTKGTAYISDFNANPYKYIKIDPNRNPRLNLQITEPKFDKEGDTVSFTNYNGNSILATCRKVITTDTKFGPKTVNIFVANNCWHTTGSKAYKINQIMVDTLADKFLRSGLNNDIYDKVTSIVGQEWGSTYNNNYIGETNNITILLNDIREDNSTNGGILGYFWSIHNFKDSGYMPVKSNERVMFFIDAVMFAREDGSTWDITDYFPRELISTLAHEFQHMIHFYQKTVVFNRPSEAWLDEMCAMVIEDLLAFDIESDGPRGVDYNDPSEGENTIYEGRLPLYNNNNDIAVAHWASNEYETLKNYSINYALGSYLARNYGGSTFFKNIVQNRYSGHQAIEFALNKMGSDDDFGTILQKWGAANLLSDRYDVDIPYKYNNENQWFIDDLGFRLGSINLYNYSYHGQIGPKIYTSPSTSNLEITSNKYFRVGSGLTGKKSWQIKMDPRGNTRLTVVKK